MQGVYSCVLFFGRQVHVGNMLLVPRIGLQSSFCVYMPPTTENTRKPGPVAEIPWRGRLSNATGIEIKVNFTHDASLS